MAACEAFSDDIPSLSRAPRVQGLRGPRYGYVPYYFRACEALSLAELGGALLKAWGATRRRGPTSCLELVIRGRQRRSGTIAIDGEVCEQGREEVRSSFNHLARIPIARCLGSPDQNQESDSSTSSLGTVSLLVVLTLERP